MCWRDGLAGSAPRSPAPAEAMPPTSESLQQQRDQIAGDFLDLLPFPPYPVQEEALLAWFSSEQGVMVCAPTGTGKTLIAEAAVYEALRLGRPAYYTTPLIALTDQKFRELQRTVAGWGFHPDDVGLVTGNRRINPEAPIQVVVAEILLNRLLHREAFDFTDVWAVVMDEFHSFNDPERGLVWEFGLGLLARQVRTLLLSATVGNAAAFGRWLETRHDRKLLLVESFDRKIPLTHQWVGDMLLDEQVESMFGGSEEGRLTPALIFCFNREQCWTVAELLKGKKVVSADQQKRLAGELENHDWSRGAGPKLKQILMRGIGVHHAGVMPRYRRIVEDLFQQRLLSVCVCTETLAAGINLPARSVLVPSLMKGPPGKMKLIEPASAHQMFGRAGRPQYDDRGFVFALAHEDDVRIARWQEKMNQIPEDTRDPGLLRARKELKKKMPRRREGVQYWNEAQFQQLVVSRSADLESRGPLSWRLLVWMLEVSSDVSLIRGLVARRLMRDRAAELADEQLDRMLITLWRGHYIELDPPPPVPRDISASVFDSAAREGADAGSEPARGNPPLDREAGTAGAAEETAPPQLSLNLGQSRVRSQPVPAAAGANPRKGPTSGTAEQPRPEWRAVTATANPGLELLTRLRGVHPLYALFLMKHMALADDSERLQAFESLLELTGSLGRAVDVPDHADLPQGPLATERLNGMLLQRGLATADEIFGRTPSGEEDGEEEKPGFYDERPPRILTLAHKLQRLFQMEYPGVTDLKIRPCWVAGEVLAFGGDFNNYVVCKKLQKQEGVLFRHLLRLVLLIDELAMICPEGMDPDDWKEAMGNLAFAIETACRSADPNSTDQWLDEARKG